MADCEQEVRARPLNLTDGELDYLWEIVKEEIGKEEVWERGDDEIVSSIHTKVHSLKGVDTDE